MFCRDTRTYNELEDDGRVSMRNTWRRDEKAEQNARRDSSPGE